MRNPDPRLFQLEQEAVNLRRDIAGASIGAHRDLESMLGTMRFTAEYLRDTVALMKLSYEHQVKTDRALSRLIEALNPTARAVRSEAEATLASFIDKKKKARSAGKRSKRKRRANDSSTTDILDASGSPG